MSNGVHRVNPLEVADWDQQLQRFPDAKFFHCTAWARVLSESYGYKPVYFTTNGNDGMDSILPMMEIESWLTGSRGVSLPFTDDCEPLGLNDESIKPLFESTLAHAAERNWKYVEYRGGRKLLGNVPPLESYFHHRLSLVKDEAFLFDQLDSSVRRAVRRAGKQDVVVEFFQSAEAMRIFYALFCKTRKRHSVPPQPFAFFENIQRHVIAQNQGWIVVARKGLQPVASAIFFSFGKSAIYKYGASDEAFQHLRANNLVIWEAIRRYANEGFTTLDFGRTALHSDGLRRFKLGWGTKESKVDYMSYDLRKRRFTQRANRSYKFLAPLYKLAPLCVLRLMGILFYKHIALLSFSFDWGQLGNCV